VTYRGLKVMTGKNANGEVGSCQSLNNDDHMTIKCNKSVDNMSTNNRYLLCSMTALTKARPGPSNTWSNRAPHNALRRTIGSRYFPTYALCGVVVPAGRGHKHHTAGR
jgi:hypothetical protein